MHTLVQASKFLEEGLPPPRSSGFLGVDLHPSEAALVLLQVPWEATTSYGSGAAKGPSSMIRASHQLDAEDSFFGKIYRAGIATEKEPLSIRRLNGRAKKAARLVIGALESARSPSIKALSSVNHASLKVNELVHSQAKKYIDQGKIVGLLGGDHSSPFGFIQALCENYESISVLHFDAHHDLRAAYEGFHHSHASIFYNVMRDFPQVTHLTQVAIRDFSNEEKSIMSTFAKSKRGSVFYARDIFSQRAEGRTLKSISEEVIGTLSNKVYVSFDIDALDPTYCPSTGTPVPGGLSFDEAVYIIQMLSQSGKKVIGFDLCEVAPGKNEWDANVGARLCYVLCGCALRSQGKI